MKNERKKVIAKEEASSKLKLSLDENKGIALGVITMLALAITGIVIWPQSLQFLGAFFIYNEGKELILKKK
mgnify:CR=1 FL=1